MSKTKILLKVQKSFRNIDTGAKEVEVEANLRIVVLVIMMIDLTETEKAK